MRVSSSIASALIAVLCVYSSSVFAAPANPAGHIYTQPDGSNTPTLFLNGNQHYAWMSDAKGYTVMKDAHGWYVYGKKVDGDIVSAGVRVGHSNPKKIGLLPQLLHDSAFRRGLEHPQETETEHRDLIAVPEKALCNFNGSKDQPCRLKGLVVLIQFKSHAARKLPSPQEYDILFNSNGPTTNNTAPSGSVADVYLANSYGSFVLESIVSDWVMLTKTEADAVDGNVGLNKPGTQKAWSEALTLAKTQFGSYKQFDGDGDGTFDSLVMMHSGTASEAGGIDVETGGDFNTRIWSHATASPWYSDAEIKVNRFYVASAVWDIKPPAGKGTKWDIARIAVIAHECAHFLGLPDLYDTTVGSGVGTFDLLGNMWGWYGDQLYPPLMSAWSKMQLGWVDTMDVLAAETNVKVIASCDGDLIYKVGYKMKAGEYFLVENRFPCGFDAKLANPTDPTKDRSGMAIWHIDETDALGKDVINYQSEGVCASGKCRMHYRVALVQGDGKFDLEKGVNKGDRTDLFRKRTDTNGALVAYKIDNKGVTLNSGAVLPEPNTRGYSGEVEYDTGISFEVGAVDKSMVLTIKLLGATGTNTGGPVALKKSSSATTTAGTISCSKLSHVEAAGYGCPSTMALSANCANEATAEFLITGVGSSPLQFSPKQCQAITTSKAATYCAALNYAVRDGQDNHPPVWTTCGAECKSFSNCP